MIKVFITYGCYLERVGMIINVLDRDTLTTSELEDVMHREAYSRGYELAEGWVGSHGFCEDDDGEALEDYHDELESHVEYTAEIYNPEEHDGWMCGKEHDEDSMRLGEPKCVK